MKIQFAVAIAAIILLYVLMVPPVISGLEGEHAEMSISVAYIYSSDTSSANSYKSLLDSNGYPTTLISMSNVADTDFSGYSVIIIGSDTGSMSTWGDTTSISVIEDSGKPIIGLGKGGYGFFRKLGLNTAKRGLKWEGLYNISVYVEHPTHIIFKTPNEIIIPEDRYIPLCNSSKFVEVFLLAPNVKVLGSCKVILTLENYKYFFGGFTASPDNMTSVGRDLFINVVDYMITHPPPENTIEVYTNEERATFTISGPANYFGNGTFWSQSNAPAGTYKITYHPTKYKYVFYPSSETKALSPGGLIVFSGRYEIPVGAPAPHRIPEMPNSHRVVPDFLAITFILAIICGYLILKKGI